MIYWTDHRGIEVDETCDASLWGLFAFGLYGANDPRIESTFKALRERLWLHEGVGGMARYENDTYQRAHQGFTGNPWFVSTLWLADYLIERAREEKDLNEALEVMEWVSSHALPSGVLAEQIDPLSGEPVSVSPLTWSHGTFVRTTQRLLRRLEKMKVCPGCGASLVGRSRSEDWVERMFDQACDAIHGSCQVR
jgi:GH15 family glucan-1,4-alpha-glucosidase